MRFAKNRAAKTGVERTYAYSYDDAGPLEQVRGTTTHPGPGEIGNEKTIIASFGRASYGGCCNVALATQTEGGKTRSARTDFCGKHLLESDNPRRG